jgi:DNA-binding Xre family transcriptional regulator
MLKISIAKMSVAMVNAGIDSSKRLAEVSGVSVNTISRLRNGGSVKLPTLRRLAEAMGVSPADLIE